MTSNISINLSSSDNSDFGLTTSNPDNFYSDYAQGITFYEWIQIFFTNKKLANTLNSLANDRHHISHTSLDLYTQSIGGENESYILKKIVEYFPRIISARIDLDNFLEFSSDFFEIFFGFAHLKSLTLYSSTHFPVLFSEFIFPKLNHFCYVNKQPAVYFELPLSFFIFKMPNLRKLSLYNVSLSSAFRNGFPNCNLEEIYFVDIESFNTDSGEIFRLKTLKKLTIRFLRLPDEQSNDLLCHVLESFSLNLPIENFTFDLPPSVFPIHFENIFNLKNLKVLSIHVSIRNMFIYYNFIRVLFLVPFLSPTIEINLNLSRSCNDFDISNYVYDDTNIFDFAHSYCTQLSVQYPNFHFFVVLNQLLHSISS